VANFKTHFTVGVTSSAVISSVLLSMKVLAPSEAIVAFVLGTLGSFLPDIDADNSKSIEIAFSVISLLVTIMFVFANVEVYSIAELLIMAAVIFLTIRFGFIDIFKKISRHRGMFHSVPVAFIWGLAVTVLIYHLFSVSALVAWIYGLMMSLGYLIHLLLDEIYSVDLENRKVKKSSGTALKLYGDNKIQNIAIYAALFVLLLMVPDCSELKEKLFSFDAWLKFKASLLPQDGVWFVH